MHRKKKTYYESKGDMWHPSSLSLDVPVEEDQVIYTESPSIRIKAWGSDPCSFIAKGEQHPLKVFDSLTHSVKD